MNADPIGMQTEDIPASDELRGAATAGWLDWRELRLVARIFHERLQRAERTIRGKMQTPRKELLEVMVELGVPETPRRVLLDHLCQRGFERSKDLLFGPGRQHGWAFTNFRLGETRGRAARILELRRRYAGVAELRGEL